MVTMRSSPGFLPYLQSQLHALGSEVLDKVNDPAGFDLSNLIEHVVRPRDHSVYDQYEVEDSAVKKWEDVDRSPTTTELGWKAISSGKLAYCILAEDVSALLKIPEINVTLLAIKLLQAQGLKHVWIMTSPSNHDSIASHLKEISSDVEVRLVQQFESVRLTPDNQLYLEDGNPSFYSCGPGDAIPALIKHGVLKEFLATGGEHVLFVNVNNLLAEPDVEVLGQHIVSNSPVTCEVVRREPHDEGGILCNHLGFDQFVARHRFSLSLEPDDFKWLSTDTFVVRADLDFSVVNWSWHRTKREFGGRLVVQHERLMHDLTATFQTQYVEVPREERFMPIRTPADLQGASRIFRKI